jgi:predicted metal-dependent hydrolase
MIILSFFVRFSNMMEVQYNVYHLNHSGLFHDMMSDLLFDFFQKDRRDMDQIRINDIDFVLKIHYEPRSNARVSIRKNNINIRIPSSLSKDKQREQLRQMKAWAIERIQKNPDRFKPVIDKKYVDGDIIKTQRKTYRIHLTYKEKKNSSAVLKEDTIMLRISSDVSSEAQQKHIKTLLSRIIGADQLPCLIERIHFLNKRYFNKKIHNISFKHNLSNWGSCSQLGNINISTRLLFAPDDVFDYVCIHELAHLIEQNHSKRFWHLVQQAVPDYKDKIQWLKENSKKCHF